MERILLVHGYSAESQGTDAVSIRQTYDPLPGLLKQQFGGLVEELDLSRYISLEDGITIDDISRAMQRALELEFPHLLSEGFNAITHSTGSLVVRNWLRRYWDSIQPCPAKRVIHLAGANWGSGWAAIGRSQLAKWGRLVFQGAERGVNVLSALELGSSWTIEMHRELNAKIEAAAADAPLEFCIAGSQRPDEFSLVPVKYATENGSDGVVRVAACNLNSSYLKFVHSAVVAGLTPEDLAVHTEDSSVVTEKDVKEPSLPVDFYRISASGKKSGVPFAVVNECSHTYKSSSILGGTRTRAQVLDLIGTALNTTAANMPATRASFDAAYASTLAAVKPKSLATYAVFVKIKRQSQYDKFAQVVFRVFDQYNAPVKHFNVFFNSFGGEEKAQKLINDLFSDGHPNGVNPNTITFYLRLEKWEDGAKDWVDQLALIGGCDLEIDAREHGNSEIAFVPFRYVLDPQTLAEWVRPNQTTVVDVHLYRMPSRDVFKIVESP
ncbi:MAG: hypothetical protein WD716_09880 [Fimbriimonadaceae bacterium]